MSQEVEIRLDDWLCLKANDEYEFPGRANGYWCPVGPTPGVAFVYMLDREFQQLKPFAPHTLNIQAGKTISIPGLYIDCAPVCSGGAPPDQNRARIVKLYDCRKILQMSSTNREFNVRCPAPPTQSIDGSETNEFYTYSLGNGAHTWDSVLRSLWLDLPSVAGAYPSLPFQPGGVPQNLRYEGANTWAAIHDVLRQINCTTAYDPTTAKFSIISLGAEQAGLADALDANMPLLEDGDIENEDLTAVPEKIRVYFHRQAEHFGTEPDTPRQNNWIQAGALSYFDQPAFGGAIKGTIVSLFDDLPAIVDFDGNLANQEALEARASERAIRWQAERTKQYPSNYIVAQGIAPEFKPGSQVSSVWWHDTGEGMMTEVVHDPLGKPVAPWNRNDKAEIERKLDENYEPPDLARHTAPIYPRVMQLIQLVSNEQDAYGRYVGYVARTDPTASYKKGAPPAKLLEPCFAVESAPNANRRRETCTLYYARLNGVSVEKTSGDALPLYVLDSAGGQVLMGKANADIAPKETGAVTIWDGAPGAEIATTTIVQLYNSGSKLTEGDWVYFTNDCTGPRLIPTAVKPILGKTTENIANGKSGKVDRYDVPDGGQQGSEEKGTQQITAFNKTHGFIPKDRWVICENTGDGWYITDPIQGDILLGRVPEAESFSQVQAHFPPTQIDIQIQPSDQAISYGGDEPKVSAFVRFFPVFDGEQVAIAWTGSVFTIVQSEFSGGILGKADAGGVSKGASVNNVSIAVDGSTPGPTLNGSVQSPLGSVGGNKLLWISNNKNGFTITSAEC